MKKVCQSFGGVDKCKAIGLQLNKFDFYFIV